MYEWFKKLNKLKKKTKWEPSVKTEVIWWVRVTHLLMFSVLCFCCNCLFPNVACVFGFFILELVNYLTCQSFDFVCIFAEGNSKTSREH